MNSQLKPMQKDDENPFRVIIAGCGGMANEWIRYTLERPDTKIVGLVDLDLQQAKKTAQHFSLDHVLMDTSLEKTIQDTKADLVYVLATPAAHYPLAKAALLSGCSVLAEKPLAASMAEAKELTELADKQQCSFSVMQNRRYLKQIRSFQDMISQQVIGTPGFLSADFFLGPHFGGFRDMMDSPLLLDMAIHTFDQARFISKADALSVYCHEFNPPGSWYKGNACAVALFEMSNGTVFSYRGSWCAEGCQTSWESDWRLTGSEGTAVWDGMSMPYAEVKPKDGQQATIDNRWLRVDGKANWAGREGHFGCLDEMFNALVAGRPAETAAHDNIKSLAMVEAAIESARLGKKISID